MAKAFLAALNFLFIVSCTHAAKEAAVKNTTGADFGAGGNCQARVVFHRLAMNFIETNPSLEPTLQKMVVTALDSIGAQVQEQSDNTDYVSTGDIPAEWLRDSSVQIRPLLFALRDDPCAASVIKKVMVRQAKMLKRDPYANAFKSSYEVWERKFELDSLCYPILLAWNYWKSTGDKSFLTSEVKEGYAAALHTMEIEQDHARNSQYSHKDLNRRPVGNTGMIWTGFRPSDDPSQLNFLIPAEMMAVQALGALAELSDGEMAKRALQLKSEVYAGIQKFAVVETDKFGPVYAYEVDGMGPVGKVRFNHPRAVSRLKGHARSVACKSESNRFGERGHVNLMDDGNLPSLLSAPLFGWPETDPIYQNTRRFALSPENPCFFHGQFQAEGGAHLSAGLGSPHTEWSEEGKGIEDMIWPLGILARAMTASSLREKCEALALLRLSDPGDHKLHESFKQNNPHKYTREDFGWPNALLFELVRKMKTDRQACK